MHRKFFWLLILFGLGVAPASAQRILALNDTLYKRVTFLLLTDSLLTFAPHQDTARTVPLSQVRYAQLGYRRFHNLHDPMFRRLAGIQFVPKQDYPFSSDPKALQTSGHYFQRAGRRLTAATAISIVGGAISTFLLLKGDLGLGIFVTTVTGVVVLVETFSGYAALVKAGRLLQYFRPGGH